MSNESFHKFEIVASKRKKAHKILTQTQDTNFGYILNKAARKRKNLSMSSKTLIFNIFQTIRNFFSQSVVRFTWMCAFVK